MANYITSFETTEAYEAGQKDYPNVSLITSDNSMIYVNESPIHDYSLDYLTFIPISGSSTFTFGNVAVQYSVDNGSTWNTLNSGVTSPSVNAGDKIMWKGNLQLTANGAGLSSTDKYNVEGNVMSLLYGDNFSGQTQIATRDYVLAGLFSNNTNLVSAENMIMPATTLYDRCYYYMFYQCTSLTTAPVLPATTLANYCYYGLFYGCTSLNNITCLATDISAAGCLSDWVRKVSSSGTFTKAASMSSWPSGNSGIPNNWSVVDYTG